MQLQHIRSCSEVELLKLRRFALVWRGNDVKHRRLAIDDNLLNLILANDLIKDVGQRLAIWSAWPRRLLMLPYLRYRKLHHRCSCYLFNLWPNGPNTEEKARRRTHAMPNFPPHIPDHAGHSSTLCPILTK